MDNHIDPIIIQGIVAVIRAKTADDALSLAEACIQGGITILEITFTVPLATQVINTLVSRHAGTPIVIGAGTVLDKISAKKARLAGASFIVSPGFDKETARYCQKNHMLHIPGCLTPTEIMKALAFDVTMVKLFPGSAFGPSYIKALKGPFPHIAIMPTGGVSLENIKTWVDAGATALGIGSDLSKGLDPNDWAGIANKARQYVDAFELARKVGL